MSSKSAQMITNVYAKQTVSCTKKATHVWFAAGLIQGHISNCDVNTLQDHSIYVYFLHGHYKDQNIPGTRI